MIENFWPTQIGSYLNPNHNDYEERLVKRCLEIKNEYKTGGTSWLSKETYNTSDGVYDILRDKDFKPINDFVHYCVNDYIKETTMNFEIRSKTAWFNVYEQGNFQETHEHYTNVISAVYFLKIPEDSSDLYFYSPFKDQMLISYNNVFFNTNHSVFFKSTPGAVIIFRSFLPHFVNTNTNKEKRITLAYNFK